MAVEPQMQRRWEEQLAGYVTASFRVLSLGNTASQLVQLVNKLVTAGVLYFGAKLARAGEDERPDDVYPTGCAGRIVRHESLEDGRSLVVLRGTVRFRIRRELPYDVPYRVVEAQALYEAPVPAEHMRPWRSELRRCVDAYMGALGGETESLDEIFAKQELERIGHALRPLDIVVVNTRAGSRYGSGDYVTAGCGMGYEATMYLLERGVRLTGTDAWSWDAPFVYTAEKFRQTGDAKLIWEGHKAGRDIGYCHLEKLHNLEALPGDGFMIACFPVKIRGASAGWTRAVAIFDEALLPSGRDRLAA